MEYIEKYGIKLSVFQNYPIYFTFFCYRMLCVRRSMNPPEFIIINMLNFRLRKLILQYISVRESMLTYPACNYKPMFKLKLLGQYTWYRIVYKTG